MTRPKMQLKEVWLHNWSSFLCNFFCGWQHQLLLNLICYFLPTMFETEAKTCCTGCSSWPRFELDRRYGAGEVPQDLILAYETRSRAIQATSASSGPCGLLLMTISRVENRV